MKSQLRSVLSLFLGLITCGSIASASPIDFGVIANLNDTPNQPATYPPLSARFGSSPSPHPISANNDKYKAAGFAYTATTLYFMDERPDQHTFGPGHESAGANVFFGGDMRIEAEDKGPIGIGDHFIRVNYFTADSTPLVPAGAVTLDGEFFTSWSLEVGTNFDFMGENWIDFLPQTGFDILDSGFAVLNDGMVLGTFPLDANPIVPEHSLGGVGVAGLGGADIGGYPVDELVMFWDIQEHTVVPEPSSAVLSLCAGLLLLVFRQRKRSD